MDDHGLNELTEAPLAQTEHELELEEEGDEEEWQDFSSQVAAGSSLGCAESTFGSSGYSSLAGTQDNLRSVAGKTPKMEQPFRGGMSHGSSLEDLVGTFDQRISQCFGDMGKDVNEDFAPVQIRTHEELIGQSKFWQDLTSSFGTVLPVDWSQTVIRNKLFLPVLSLNTQQGNPAQRHARANGLEANSSSSDEELNNQLDMHRIICSDSDPHNNGLASVDDVIREIESIMQQGEGYGAGDMAHRPETDARLGFNETERTGGASASDGDGDGCSAGTASLPTLPSPLFEEKLQDLNSGELLELQTELERLTQKYSEILIQELALRDEQQFEKEVKNSFISELIKVQAKRRQFAVDKKRGAAAPVSLKAKTPDREAKYLTTVIPYDPASHLTTRHMQIMMKILAAINEDSPTTPALLTDYILKVLCPKELASI